jgi:galactofuranose transport system ATP-binding protein
VFFAFSQIWGFNSGAGVTLLSMRNISKSFARIPALDRAEVEIRAGEIHALVGQNGAGKSTLIKILTGYYQKDAGEITFAGQPFSVGSPREAQSRGVSTIYQEINLVPMRSVAENICLGRPFRKHGFLDWKAMHEEAHRLLSKFNINIGLDTPLGAHSTATQQMVAIARAIGFDAKLVIMDEPTSSLDAREVEVLFGVIRQLKVQGISVIFVSHKLDELYEVCDHLTIMRDGRTVRTGAIEDISKIELVSSMLGRTLERRQGRTTGFGAHTVSAGQDGLFSARNLSDGQTVRDVSLNVNKGEIAGIAGLLGSGRTETARVIFGEKPLKHGGMSLGEEGYAPRKPSDAIGNGIGFCTEDRKHEGIVPEMSIAENMMLALMPKLARAGIVDAEEQKRLVNQFIAQLGIKCTGPDQKIRELSGGNQQKVLLGRWLAMNPRLLILDEPTRGIDVGAKGEIQKLIRKLADEGLGVLMISSELDEIVEGSDRVFVLRDGVKVAELRGDDIDEGAVMSAMAEGAHQTGMI